MRDRCGSNIWRSSILERKASWRSSASTITALSASDSSSARAWLHAISDKRRNM